MAIVPFERDMRPGLDIAAYYKQSTRREGAINTSETIQTYRFRSKAIQILKSNSFETQISGQTYFVIMPSKEYYGRNEWEWDGAREVEAIDQYAALQNLYFLIASQWKNGHIGHIIFGDEKLPYFPGPGFWGTEGRSESGILSSGIIQPPLLAISLVHLYEQSTDPEIKQQLITKILPAIMKHHDYLQETHDQENSGLISIFQPWSSGSDNSNAFDSQMQAIVTIPQYIKHLVQIHRVDNINGNKEGRPLDDDYYRYIYLMTMYKDLDWDYYEIAKQTPFAVKDIAVNAIWCYANETLGNFLLSLGRFQEAEKYVKLAKKTRNAIQNTWDEEQGIFANIDVANGKWKPVIEERFANFMPFLAGAVTNKQAAVLLKKLRDPHMYWTDYPVPTVPINHEKFELTRYWRGPTWPIINDLIIRGLERFSVSPAYSKDEIEQRQIAGETANELLFKTLAMIEENGFFESFLPIKLNVENRSFCDFSFTAAEYILLDRKRQDYLSNVLRSR